MEKSRYITLGPLLAGEGSRAFLGLRIAIPQVHPIVLVRVPEHTYSNPSLLNQLRLDIQQASLLEHPNIVRVFGLAEMEEGLSRAVEFVNGESLRRIFDASKRQRMPPGLAARIVTDAAWGVHYAHLAGTDDGSPLLHGDLRPETIFVSYAGITKVSGYGAYCMAPKETGDGVTKRRLYWAPEQILGGNKEISEQTDVYQLGITLYEAITGSTPVHRSESPLEDAAINYQAIPEKLRPIISKATAQKSSERFSTPVALGDALEEAMGSLPSTDALAFYLEGLFSGDSLRATRLEVIEKGLADFASDLPRPDSLATLSSPLPVDTKNRREMPSSEQIPTKLAAPPTTSTSVVHQAAKPLVTAQPEELSVQPDPTTTTSSAGHPASLPARQPESSRSWFYFSIASNVVLAIAALVFFFAWRQAVSRSPTKADSLTAPSKTVPSAAPSLAGPKSSLDTPLPTSAGTAGTGPLNRIPENDRFSNAPYVPANEQIDEPDEPIDEPSPDEPKLVLSVVPAVGVWIDGKKAGVTPLTADLEPGPHRVTLLNSRLGIRVKRTITVRPYGKTYSKITLGKGTVLVNAPPGATIFIDGKRVGEAPLSKEISVYEGNHRISVRFQGAQWKQNFALGNKENIRFDVASEN